MSPILSHLPEQNAFEPETIAAMSKAFEETCAALHVFGDDVNGREIIATRIIDLARRGVIDPNALRERVLREAEGA